MRNMSFSLTTDQIRNRTKTVTRRLGWSFLKPGQLVCACVKCMGLKPDQKVDRLAILRVRSVTRPLLIDIDENDPEREGFPDMEPDEFIDMFCHHMGCDMYDRVTRIEFDYVPGGRFDG